MCTKLISPETWLLAYSATSLWNAGVTYHTWWSPQKSPKSLIVFSKLECLSVRGHVLLLNHLKILCFVHCLVFVKRQFSVCASRKFDIQINLKSQLWKAFQHYISKALPQWLQYDWRNLGGGKVVIFCRVLIFIFKNALWDNFVLVFGQPIVFPGYFGLIWVH